MSDKNDEFGDLDDIGLDGDILDGDIDLDDADFDDVDLGEGDDWGPAQEAGPEGLAGPADIDAEDDAASAEKKPNKLAGMAVLTVGGLALLGFGWFALSPILLSSGGTPPAPAPVTAPAQTAQPAAPRPPKPTPMPAADPAPLDLMALREGDPPQDAAPEPPASGFLTDPAALEAQITALQERPPIPEQEGPIEDVLTPMPVEVALPVVDATPDPTFEARLAEAQAMHKAAEDRADALESETQELKDQVTALEATIAKMEVKISALQAARPKPTATARAKPRTATPTRTPPRRAAEPAWVLRSASPGSALVSRGRSGDVYTVTVGATLPGLGRVTAVDRDPATGRWVVTGTRGKVKQ